MASQTPPDETQFNDSFPQPSRDAETSLTNSDGTYRQGPKCIARVSNGDRCSRAATNGTSLCHLHGGTGHLGLTNARMRLTAMATPAMNVIEKVLTIEPACKVCGRFDDPSLAVRAAFAILDRTGFGPSSKVEVDVPSMTNLTHETKSQLVARLELLKNTISEMPETVEAEVVRED